MPRRPPGIVAFATSDRRSQLSGTHPTTSAKARRTPDSCAPAGGRRCLSAGNLAAFRTLLRRCAEVVATGDAQPRRRAASSAKAAADEDHIDKREEGEKGDEEGEGKQDDPPS